MVSEVTVIVQTCQERKKLLAPTLDSLLESDARDSFRVLLHPQGERHCRFFRSVLIAMAAVSTPWVIRLEDDVLVNRHLLHNFLTWPALSDPRFGAGWLFSPQILLNQTQLEQGHYIRNDPIMSYAFGVGLKAETAQACIDEYDRWIAEYGCGLHHCTRRGCTFVTKPHPPNQMGQDALFSRAVWGLNKRIFLCEPSLVETRLLPTTIGTTFWSDNEMSAGLRFNKDWCR